MVEYAARRTSVARRARLSLLMRFRTYSRLVLSPPGGQRQGARRRIPYQGVSRGWYRAA